MSEDDLAVGRRIAEARESLGLSQRDLAGFAGMSQPTIQRIETGSRRATTLELSTLADACGVPVAELRGDSTLASEVLCAGRTNGDGSQALTDYLLFAFGLAQRLDELGVEEVE